MLCCYSAHLVTIFAWQRLVLIASFVRIHPQKLELIMKTFRITCKLNLVQNSLESDLFIYKKVSKRILYCHIKYAVSEPIDIYAHLARSKHKILIGLLIQNEGTDANSQLSPYKQLKPGYDKVTNSYCTRLEALIVQSYRRWCTFTHPDWTSDKELHIPILAVINCSTLIALQLQIRKSIEILFGQLFDSQIGFYPLWSDRKYTAGLIPREATS